ncbi:HpcH/HpaI aldolase/citrate lyase family protein [Luteibacter flocculans]|uniref:HpcH/HpaI aldolase/citrate lyase family protein n=1 Tax=Luteibacter flocculans TaxID=2780091 RepID=A0ABY4TAE4_9GAMM|nr:aldolase/citrate lyase family protein [Luteibacter flocculans]URL59686.1 HpcH/HpaI aldolase/citrate lyase family protein [Luteibacter flocculans]
MRSKLFVPGGRPELFVKALASAADAVSFDLEDAVPPEAKSSARDAVAAFVGSAAMRDAAKLCIVRINAPDSPYFEDDLRAVVQPGLSLLNIPKLESADAVRAVVAALERAEALQRMAQPVGLLVNVETPRALAQAAAMASAHTRVAGLQLGLADLFEPYHVDRTDGAAVHAAMFAVKMAAASADVFAVDAAFAAVDDADGYRAEAIMARRLGFIGKTCIHPRQVALANAVFAPSPEELAVARRVVAAAADAARDGRGAFLLDGRMIDLPFVKRAQALLASHE